MRELARDICKGILLVVLILGGSVLFIRWLIAVDEQRHAQSEVARVAAIKFFEEKGQDGKFRAQIQTSEISPSLTWRMHLADEQGRYLAVDFSGKQRCKYAGTWVTLHLSEGQSHEASRMQQPGDWMLVSCN